MHIIPSADPSTGGPIESAVRMGEVWRALGHTQHLVTLDDPEAACVRDCPSPVMALGGRRLLPRFVAPLLPWRRFGYSPGAVRWIRDHAEDYDVAIVSSLWNYAPMMARRALVGGRLPFVVFTHGMLDPWFRRTYPLKHAAKQLFWLFSEGVLLSNARMVLFTTDEERLLARSAFWPYKVREKVVNYGAAEVENEPERQLAAFRAACPEAADEKFLLFLSRIHPKKGCDLLIRAFAAVMGQEPEWRLMIAGPDHVQWTSELRKLGSELGIADRIVWPGMLSGDAKWGAYRACAGFVLPSHQENFGIVVPEAMACSRPVLITDKVNLWREVAADEAGLVESDDQAGVERLLRGFLQMSDGERDAMGRRARASFERRFRIERAAAELVALLQTLVPRR